MSTLKFSRCQLRRIACVTLLAWVLALMSGVVNACLLQPHGVAASAASANTNAEFSNAVPVDSSAAHVEHGHHHRLEVRQVNHDGAKQDAGNAGCLKFCSD